MGWRQQLAEARPARSPDVPRGEARRVEVAGFDLGPDCSRGVSLECGRAAVGAASMRLEIFRPRNCAGDRGSILPILAEFLTRTARARCPVRRWSMPRARCDSAWR